MAALMRKEAGRNPIARPHAAVVFGGNHGRVKVFDPCVNNPCLLLGRRRMLPGQWEVGGRPNWEKGDTARLAGCAMTEGTLITLRRQRGVPWGQNLLRAEEFLSSP